jgi:c-di-GMP-binding flagellar brake protein YcgR
MLDRYNEKRKKYRIPCCHDCYYYKKDKSEKHEFSLVNISATGACIESDLKIKKDDVINIHINCGKEVVFSAKAVWEREQTYGVLFILESPEDLTNISFLLNNVRMNEK